MGRTSKWWIKPLCYVIDVMVANANVVYNDMADARRRDELKKSPVPTTLPRNCSRLTRRQFVIAMLEDLEVELRRKKAAEAAAQTRATVHVPVLREKKARCWVCKSGGKTRLTKTGCLSSDCPRHLRLCHPQMSWEKRDCFARYHRQPHEFHGKRRSLSPSEASHRPAQRRRL